MNRTGTLLCSCTICHLRALLFQLWQGCAEKPLYVDGGLDRNLEEGVGHVEGEALLGPGGGHIEDPRLLLRVQQGVHVVYREDAGEGVQHDDRVELQALGGGMVVRVTLASAVAVVLLRA